MTDPIGTAQERELIETLKAYAKRMREHATLSHGFSTPSGMSQLAARDYDQAADALQSRIAEVERLIGHIAFLNMQISALSVLNTPAQHRKL